MALLSAAANEGMREHPVSGLILELFSEEVKLCLLSESVSSSLLHFLTLMSSSVSALTANFTGTLPIPVYDNFYLKALS